MAASCSKSGIPAGGTRGPASPSCNLSRTPAVSLFSLPRSGTRHALSLGCSADRHSASGFAGAEDNERFVRCFRQAWPYIRGHSGSTFVVVISGEIVDSPYLDGILRDISLLHGLGIRFVIVPGTHVLIDKLLEEKGSQGKYVGRFRITDSKSLEAAMEVAGRICLAIESKLSPGPPILSLRRHGGSHHWHELGVSVTSGNFLAAKRRGVVGGIDFGSTGEVKRIDVRRIQEWLDKECIVIVSNLGYSSAGEVLNCNYEVATACALAINAVKLICITDGKIEDEQGRLIRFMTLEDADMLIRKHAMQSEIAANYVQAVTEESNSPWYIDSHQDSNISQNEKSYSGGCNVAFHNGVGFDNGNGLWSEKQGFAIGGEERLGRLSGYLSELAAAAYVCRGGVQRVHIIDGTLIGALLLELFTRDGVGTMVASDIYEGTRSARTGDLPGIRKVIQPLEDSDVLIHRNIEELLKQLGSFIVIERDGSVIACAAFIPFFEDNYGEIAAIAVSPECRGQGKGDKLLDFIEKKALSLGLDKLFLLTTRAADWFVRRGFTECSIESIPSERKKSINISRGSKCYMKKLQMPLR
ncbi:putative amino-acid acetyltransferase NAGS2, chloroplastic isoform X2 [Curcuma longa]|uniref:putative amino-acid acetyltransferase NAGS2, chloroplastic isoform X2 n=1 Tax=Curcuma longa TaxID=136217 RepID=UPI003D9DCD17